MYKKPSKIISNKQELSNYISDIDLYNSELLLRLNNPTLTKEPYVITTYEYRPDLIAEEFYGSTSYVGLVILQAARPFNTFTRGSVINLITKSQIDSILSTI